ncbi:MAG: hypothetical protein KAI66_10975, partial [Lentisphaeria bacterium]|nr:hypothetical protein [Lentisphaeria bacterium]
DRSNGCEQEQNVEHCGACRENCLLQPNVQNATCDTLTNRCVFECVAGWGDCDSNSAGCETAFDSTNNCGGCGIVCAGPLCDEGADGFFCGCDLSQNDGIAAGNLDDPDGNPDCYPEEICCSGDDGRGACIPHNGEHCFDCEGACAPDTGGPYCEPTGVNGSWLCICTGEDETCKNYVFSDAFCSPDTDQCGCGTQSDGCEPPEACCSTSNDNAECTDLSIDSANCGICGAACWTGEQCVNGACECLAGYCAGPPGIACINEICVCEGYNDQPCPISMYCRANGCCLDAYSDECCGGGDVWCSDGSCRQPENCP